MSRTGARAAALAGESGAFSHPSAGLYGASPATPGSPDDGVLDSEQHTQPADYYGAHRCCPVPCVLDVFLVVLVHCVACCRG